MVKKLLRPDECAHSPDGLAVAVRYGVLHVEGAKALHGEEQLAHHRLAFQGALHLFLRRDVGTFELPAFLGFDDLHDAGLVDEGEINHLRIGLGEIRNSLPHPILVAGFVKCRDLVACRQHLRAKVRKYRGGLSGGIIQQDGPVRRPLVLALGPLLHLPSAQTGGEYQQRGEERSA